jgi:hypothetical protein
MWDLLAAIADLLTSLPGGRVTVAERYAMKRRVRELKKRERAVQSAASPARRASKG